MAVYQVTATGTKTTGTSTAGDWTTNSNNYGSIQTAMNQAWTSGDKIVLDDATFSVASLNLNTTAAAAGTLTMESRSLNPANCVVSFTDTGSSGFNMADATVIYSALFKGITFTKPATITTTSTHLFQIAGIHNNATWDNCVLGPCTLADATNATRNQPIINANTIVAPRTLTFTGCTIKDMTIDILSGYSLMRAYSGNNVVFTDTTFSGIDIDINAGTNSHFGPIFIDGGASLAINGVTVSSVVCDSVSTTAIANSAFFSVQPSASVTVDGLTARNMAWSGGACGAVLLRTQGAYTVSGITAHDCSSTPATGINSVGGVFLAEGNGAQGTLTNHRVYNCISDFGVASYHTSGGGGVCTDIVAVGCTARVEGILYAGGWGDVTWDDFSLIGCLSGLEMDGTQGLGGVIYAHSRVDSTRAKSTLVSNGHILNCRQGQGGEVGITFAGYSATYAHTAAANDVVIDCPGHAVNIDCLSTGSNLLNVAISGLSLLGGADTSPRQQRRTRNNHAWRGHSATYHDQAWRVARQWRYAESSVANARKPNLRLVFGTRSDKPMRNTVPLGFDATWNGVLRVRPASVSACANVRTLYRR